MKKYQKTNFGFLIENIEARRSIIIGMANSQCFFSLAGRARVGQSLVNAIKIQRRKNKKQKKNKK